MSNPIEEIQRILYWDQARGDWKDLANDPQWNGLDELCAIDAVLRSFGLVPKPGDLGLGPR